MDDIIIVLLIVAFVLNIFIAMRFKKIVEMKGYDGKAVFWWTLFVMPVGVAMAIALPDKAVIYEISGLRSDLMRVLQTDSSNVKAQKDTSHKEGTLSTSSKKYTKVANVSVDESGKISVLTPFRGTILKSLVESGMSVKMGQELFVIKNMGTEISLLAPMDGTIIDIDVYEDRKVEKDDLLTMMR